MFRILLNIKSLKGHKDFFQNLPSSNSSAHKIIVLNLIGGEFERKNSSFEKNQNRTCQRFDLNRLANFTRSN